MSLQFIAPETKPLGIKIIKEFTVNAEMVLKSLKKLENPSFQEQQIKRNLTWRLEEEKLHLKEVREVLGSVVVKNAAVGVAGERSEGTLDHQTAAVSKEKVGKKKKGGSKWN